MTSPTVKSRAHRALRQLPRFTSQEADLVRYANVLRLNVFEARSRDGARVYFRQGKSGVEILGKSDKNNQEQVIKRLKELYDK